MVRLLHRVHGVDASDRRPTYFPSLCRLPMATWKSISGLSLNQPAGWSLSSPRPRSYLRRGWAMTASNINDLRSSSLGAAHPITPQFARHLFTNRDLCRLLFVTWLLISVYVCGQLELPIISPCIRQTLKPSIHCPDVTDQHNAGVRLARIHPGCVNTNKER